MSLQPIIHYSHSSIGEYLLSQFLFKLFLFRRKQLLSIRKDMQTAKDLVFSSYQNLENILTNSNVRISMEKLLLLFNE